MEYNFISIEEKWQRYWREKKVYSSSNNSDLPKYYVLDMFPYPSGSGLHVGHPLGYIASDIISRYKRTCLLYTSPSPRDTDKSRMPSSA